MGKAILDIRDASKKLCLHPGMAPLYAVEDIFRALVRTPGEGRLRKWEFWALRHVNLEIKTGEIVGVIGCNGAGKSTLLNLAAGIIRPTAGLVGLHTGRAVVMDNEAGLSPLQSGMDNIRNKLALHGSSADDIRRDMEEIIGYSGLGEFIHVPVGLYSLGMKLRLSLSIYAHLRPGIFFVDEVLGGGDVHFRNKFLRFIQDYIAKGGAMLFVSHELFTVQAICHRCILLDQGRVVMVGSPAEAIHTYVSSREHKEPVDTEKPGLRPVRQGSGEEEWHMGGDVFFKQTDGPRSLTARIESICVRGPQNGKPFTGRPASIRMLCHSLGHVSRVIWGIQIGRADLFPLATMQGGHDEQIYSLKPGWNEFLCSVEKLPLLPGGYQIHTAIANASSGEVLGLLGLGDSQPAWFQVVADPCPARNIEILERGMVHVPVTWEKNL